MIGIKNMWKRFEKLSMKIKYCSHQWKDLLIENSTLIHPHIRLIKTLVQETWKLRPKLKKNIALFVKNSKTENVIPKLFKARKPLHCIPEASRNVSESKSSTLTSRNGRTKWSCFKFYTYSCFSFQAFSLHFFCGFILIDWF